MATTSAFLHLRSLNSNTDIRELAPATCARYRSRANTKQFHSPERKDFQPPHPPNDLLTLGQQDFPHFQPLCAVMWSKILGVVLTNTRLLSRLKTIFASTHPHTHSHAHKAFQSGTQSPQCILLNEHRASSKGQRLEQHGGINVCLCDC